MKTYRLIVSGRVQRVNYRKFVVEMAEALDYNGYVKNLLDGNVEIMINAEFEEDLEFFVSKLYDGSMFSHVEYVECMEVEHVLFRHFERK